MKKYLSILNIINVFGQISVTRIADFTGNPDVSTRTYVDELVEANLVHEGNGPKGTRTIYSLTENGETFLEFSKELIPQLFEMKISDLKRKQIEKCLKIFDSLKSGTKTTEDLVNETEIKNRELSFYTNYLEEAGYIDTVVENEIISYVIIKEPELFELNGQND